jgi:hypothetical protein
MATSHQRKGHTMNIETIKLTDASLALFLEYAEDAPNWGGSPWVSAGNVWLTKEQRGNITDLKKKGLVEIGDSEGLGKSRDQYLIFTEAGIALARSHGFEIR